jgi:predicted metal-dependent hydrolase
VRASRALPKGHSIVTRDATPAAPSPSPATRDAARERRTILLDGRELAYTLRESPRARRLRLLIRPEGGLEVVVPRRTTRARIEQVLREKAGWIDATLARLAREAAAIPAPAPLAHGQTLPFAGHELRLALLLAAPGKRSYTRLTGQTLALTVADGRQETIRAALEAWYRAQARTVFAERIAHCNAVYGFTFGRVSIKEQKSRWGSCSRAGNLNFNWRLLLAPLPVLDYVVYHELAHLKELNHSPRFWRLVARACPDYETHRAWLSRHGRTLRL